PLVPIKHPIRVVMKVDKFDSTGKSAIYHIESNRYEYLSSTFTNGKVTFSAPKLGEFVLLTDLVAPIITKISITNRSARLRIRDNLSGIEKIEANIDGKWLLMRYDYKTGIVQSEQLDSKTMLKGMFELKVTDRAGNDRIFKYRIL
ncbi:MAG: M23 family peptidase, partial [Flammeovirgaceae bacterium]